MTAVFTEKPEFKLGRAGELLVSAWLQGRGWFVIPSYDYSGIGRDKAPKMRGIRNSFPVPDLDACRSGDRRWVEVKTKTSAAMYHKTGQYQHGIEHYVDYVRVQQETGNKAWLAVLETATIETADEKGEAGLLLMQSFVNLGEPQRGTVRGKAMANWPRGRFIRAFTFLDIDNAMRNYAEEGVSGGVKP
jgi:hypothetical protein